MESSERVVQDVVGKEITPGTMVAMSVENKQQIGLVSEIQWNTIEFCGKEKIYPTLKVLVPGSRWDKNRQRFAGLLRTVKTNKLSNIICIDNSYIEMIEKNTEKETDIDIFYLLKEEIRKTKKLKIAS